MHAPEDHSVEWLDYMIAPVLDQLDRAKLADNGNGTIFVDYLASL